MCATGEKAQRFCLTCYRLICYTIERHENTFKLYVCVSVTVCVQFQLSVLLDVAMEEFIHPKNHALDDASKAKIGQEILIIAPKHLIVLFTRWNCRILKLGKRNFSTLLLTFCICLTCDVIWCICHVRKKQYREMTENCSSLHRQWYLCSICNEMCNLNGPSESYCIHGWEIFFLSYHCHFFRSVACISCVFLTFS